MGFRRFMFRGVMKVREGMGPRLFAALNLCRLRALGGAAA